MGIVVEVFRKINIREGRGRSMSHKESNIVELEEHEIPSKTVTPLYTKDWYIKWAASFVLIAGMLCTANNIFPLNLYFHLGGLAGWFIVGMIWNDRALIIINAIGIAIMANGLLTYYTGSAAG